MGVSSITRNYFGFGFADAIYGVSSYSYGIGINSPNVWNSPAKKGESISVPGRNGNIWADDSSFENIQITYPCWMSNGFDEKIDEFREKLEGISDGYYMLEDSYHPKEYRKARFIGVFEPEAGAANKSGRFNVTFDCFPQRFLKSGNHAVYSYPTDEGHFGGNIRIFENPTRFNAFPELVFDCTNGATFWFYKSWSNNQGYAWVRKITFEPCDIVIGSYYATFDTQTLQCKNQGALLDFELEFGDSSVTEFFLNMNDHIDYPELSVQYAAVIESDVAFTVYPRWYTI